MYDKRAHVKLGSLKIKERKGAERTFAEAIGISMCS